MGKIKNEQFKKSVLLASFGEKKIVYENKHTLCVLRNRKKIVVQSNMLH